MYLCSGRWTRLKRRTAPYSINFICLSLVLEECVDPAEDRLAALMRCQTPQTANLTDLFLHREVKLTSRVTFPSES